MRRTTAERSKPIARVPLLAMLVPVAGCDPVLDVTGAFFPAWAACLALGVVATTLLRLVFVRSGLEPHLQPLSLVYSCLVALVSIGLWLVLYRS